METVLLYTQFGLTPNRLSSQPVCKTVQPPFLPLAARATYLLLDRVSIQVRASADAFDSKLALLSIGAGQTK